MNTSFDTNRAGQGPLAQAGQARPQRIVVLGSTGSIGRSTLAVIAHQPERFQAWALVARSDVEQMREQVLATRAPYAVMVDPMAAQRLKSALPTGTRTEVLSGEQAGAVVGHGHGPVQNPHCSMLSSLQPVLDLHLHLLLNHSTKPI
jgi:hypothetical protein